MSGNYPFDITICRGVYLGWFGWGTDHREHWTRYRRGIICWLGPPVELY